jgi:hypothetical protein
MNKEILFSDVFNALVQHGIDMTMLTFENVFTFIELLSQLRAQILLDTSIYHLSSGAPVPLPMQVVAFVHQVLPKWSEAVILQMWAAIGSLVMNTDDANDTGTGYLYFQAKTKTYKEIFAQHGKAFNIGAIILIHRVII